MSFRTIRILKEKTNFRVTYIRKPQSGAELSLISEQSGGLSEGADIKSAVEKALQNRTLLVEVKNDLNELYKIGVQSDWDWLKLCELAKHAE